MSTSRYRIIRGTSEYAFADISVESEVAKLNLCERALKLVFMSAMRTMFGESGLAISIDVLKFDKKNNRAHIRFPGKQGFRNDFTLLHLNMNDSVWNLECDSLIDPVSYGSEFSLGEDCDLENDEWVQDMLINIDKVILLDKKPSPKLPTYLIEECKEWKCKFKEKYSETERGAIFLKFSNCPDHLLDTFSRPSRYPSGQSKVSVVRTNSTSSKSSSSFENSDNNFNLSNLSINDTRVPSSKSVMLEPINKPEKLQRKVFIEIQRKPPLQLPPLQPELKPQFSKIWGSLSTRRGFPAPPVVFSIEKLLPPKISPQAKHKTFSVGEKLSVSTRR